MGVKIEFDMRAIKGLEEAVKKSAEEAMEQVLTDLVNSNTMPFAIGDMQDNQTFVAVEGDTVKLVTGSPQARRLYYHPEYDFQQGHNDNAGGLWLDPYIDGDKKDFAKNAFEADFKERSGV